MHTDIVPTLASTMDGMTQGSVITVVIPTYNRAGSIIQAIESVLTQSGPPCSVIVVDDGSTDGTVDLLQTREDGLVQVVHVPHGGVCAARNRGAQLAATPWIAFLDSDDCMLPGWVAAMTSAMGDGISLVSCGAAFHYPDGREERAEPSDLGPAFGSIRALFLAGTFVTTTALFRRVGGYLDGLEYSENTELGMRLGTELVADGERASVADGHLLHVNSVVRQNLSPRLYRSGLMILSKPDHPIRRDPELHARYLTIAGVAASRSGHRRDACRLLIRAWRMQPMQWRHPLRILRATVLTGRRS